MRKDMNDLNDAEFENPGLNQSDYTCDKCGKNFGISLGDMELHKTIVHLQNEDMNEN